VRRGQAVRRTVPLRAGDAEAAQRDRQGDVARTGCPECLRTALRKRPAAELSGSAV